MALEVRALIIRFDEVVEGGNLHKEISAYEKRERSELSAYIQSIGHGTHIGRMAVTTQKRVLIKKRI